MHVKVEMYGLKKKKFHTLYLTLPHIYTYTLIVTFMCSFHLTFFIWKSESIHATFCFHIFKSAYSRFHKHSHHLYFPFITNVELLVKVTQI